MVVSNSKNNFERKWWKRAEPQERRKRKSFKVGGKAAESQTKSPTLVMYEYRADGFI